MKPVTQNFAQVLAGQNSRIGNRTLNATGGQKIGNWSYNGAAIVAVAKNGGFAVITKDGPNASTFAIKGGEWLKYAGFPAETYNQFLDDSLLGGTPVTDSDIALYNSAIGSTTLPPINLGNGSSIISGGTTNTNTSTNTGGFLATTQNKIIAGIAVIVTVFGVVFLLKKK